MTAERAGRMPGRVKSLFLAAAELTAVAGMLTVRPISQAQSPTTSATMEFDVASVKQNKLGPGSGMMPRSNFPLGPGAMYSPNGGVFSATNQPIWVYIMFAYKMTDHEVQSLRRQLPDWAIEDRFDIEAKTDRHDATKDEMRLMMQSLLAERLKLAVHTTTEEVPVYGLVLAKPGKTGPKLQPHRADDASCPNAASSASTLDPAPAAAPPTTVAGGFPLICGGAAFVPASVPGRIAAGYRNVPIKLIALQMTLMGGLNRPVIDQTGLVGNFDFVIEFTPELTPGAAPPADFDSTGPAFQQALAEQTGLKLVPQKASVDVIHIDHIERPSAN